ncbi:MAG: 50S ribosomal protein L1 [Candidatus Micrarchaeota archaeon]
MIDKKVIEHAVEQALAEGKGKRKFSQSIDLAINFKDIDFKKTENRLNIEVVLPHVFKPVKIAVFAEGETATKAKPLVDAVYGSADIDSFAKDKVKQKELLEFTLLAEPRLMAPIGKSLGQLLGAKGKLPRPLPPNVDLKSLVDKTRRTKVIKTKGKGLPTVHCGFGNEGMAAPELAENAFAVLESIEKKVGENKVKSAFIKTTMGKPVKVQ